MKGWESYEEESLERLNENKFIFICLYGSFFSLRGEPRNAWGIWWEIKGGKWMVLYYTVCVCVCSDCASSRLFLKIYLFLLFLLSQFSSKFSLYQSNNCVLLSQTGQDKLNRGRRTFPCVLWEESLVKVSWCIDLVFAHILFRDWKTSHVFFSFSFFFFLNKLL